MPFLAPIFAPIGAFFFGNATATAVTLSAISAGTSFWANSAAQSASKQQTPNLQSPPPPPPPPTAPSYAAIRAAESAKLLKVTQARTKRILTSPLGVTNPQETKHKLLLGA